MRPLLLLSLLLLLLPLHAQEDDVRNHPWQVFVEADIDETGLDRLIMVDMLTGNDLRFEVYGERFTIYKRSVLFFDQLNRRVMLAAPDGELREHPFIQLPPDARRVDWVISDDGTRVAWTVTRAQAGNLLTTTSFIARLDGTEQREILTDGPRQDVRALPLALTGDTLYFDLGYIDGLENFTDFNLYAGVAALDLTTGTLTPLPDEAPANCLCGADLREQRFGRLRLTNDLTGFNFHIYNLQAGMSDVIPALNLPNYTTGGDVLLSPDGTQAVYALARVDNFGTPEQTNQTVFVLADLETLTQEALTRPITTFVVPVAWTEDNSAIILTNPRRNGTWKLNLSDGRLARIAEATFLGSL